MTMLKLWNEKTKSDPFVDLVDSFFFSPYVRDYGYQKTNVTSTDNEYVLTFAVPGVPKEDIKVSIKDDVLCVQYEKEENTDTSSFTSSFKKKYTIPSECDVDSITSKMENGVLTVTLPKQENKKIEKLIQIK